MTLAEALEELRDTVQATMMPTLEDATLRRILRRTTRVKVFAVGGVYQRGQLIAPASANLDNYSGAVYLVTVGGIATSEPSWSSASLPLASGPVQFAFYGPCPADGPFDMHEATREGWKAKMSVATEMIHSSEGGVNQDWQQIFDHCEARWKACGPAAVVG